MSQLLSSLSFLAPVLNYLFSKVLSYFSKTAHIDAICCPYIEKSLLDNLSSKNTYIVNLDDEIKNSLDVDEKEQKPIGALISARIIFNKSGNIVDELKDVIMNSSNAITNFIFISIDYRLLKYSQTGSKILYCMPSDAYYQILKQNPEFDNVLYTKIKTDLILRKSEKINVYHSLNDLQNIICKNFSNVNIKI